MGRGLNRRQFINALAGAGATMSAARALAEEYSPFVVLPDRSEPAPLPKWARSVEGTGGRLMVEQLKASACQYVFVTPSSGEAPIFDALVDEPDIHLIQVLHEGSLAAIADGYGRASRRVPFVMLARP